MHKVCKNIRDPELWAGVAPDDMFGIYLRRMDRRVTLAFAPERERTVVAVRDPLFDHDRPSA